MTTLPHQSEADKTVPREAGIDLGEALRRLGGDTALLRELAAIVVADAPGLLTQALAGLDSGESEPAVRAAHSLKGLVSSFSPAAAGAAEAAELELGGGDRVRTEGALRVLRDCVVRLIDELQRTVLSH